MRKIRILLFIVRRSGADKIVLGFLLTFFICGLVVLISEPQVNAYGDALWFLWAVATTVGLGDVTAVTTLGRVAAVVCSVYALITVAIITALVVDYFNETRQSQFDRSLSELLDKLERLPELSQEELVQISSRVKSFRK